MTSYASEITGGETASLMGNGHGSTSNGDRSASRRRMTGLALASVLLIAGFCYVTLKKPEETVTFPVHDEAATGASGSVPRRYRPFCQTFTSAKPRLIQTSMAAPSQQWSELNCYPSAEAKSRLPWSGPHSPLNDYQAPDAVLQVNFSNTGNFHPILGFGGAFTEASALNFERLSEIGKTTALELLFGKSGLGYSIGRFPMNSCDFSVKSYSFDETDGDFRLDDFDVGVQHDVESGMIDFALRATSLLRQSWGSETLADNSDASMVDGEMKLFASPWSPPAWMKQPTWEDEKGAQHAAKMTYSAQPSCLREGTGPDSKYAAAWALYFSKFLTAYADLGLPLWAVTVQNEPEFPAPWEACSYTPETQLAFLAHHLGPRLRQDHPDTKILMFDHNKDHVNTWVKHILNETSAARNFVDGTAYHWYAGGMDRLLDGALGIPNMHRLQDDLVSLGMQANHVVLGTESCHCPTTAYAGGSLNVAWDRAERYVHTILADLAAGSHGWVEWNLILDGIGGPNHLGNLCETTILSVPHRALDAREDMAPLPDFEPNVPFGNVSIGDGRTREELNALGVSAKYLDVGLAVQPIYYYMGHISRYVRPGSVAVHGLVQSSHGPGQVFRPEGSVVAGGGLNSLARDGIELTVWPCEGSTRQQFKWNTEHQKHIQVLGHDWLGVPTTSCVEYKVDPDLHGVRLTGCGKHAGVFDLIPIGGEAQPDLFHVKLLNHPRRTHDPCLVIEELGNGGGAYGPRGGAPVTLGDCGSRAAEWTLNLETGEASSLYFANEENDKPVCLTTGWPFLQMGAFLTPHGDSPKTVVVLNEANDAANYALKDESGVVLTGSVPARSLQTLLL